MSDAIDENVLEELLALGPNGDPELLVDLILAFLEHGPDQVETILQGLEDQDFPRMAQGALTLMGVAGNLGALTLLATCERLQAASRQHNLEEAVQLGDVLTENFEEAFEALERLLEVYG